MPSYAKEITTQFVYQQIFNPLSRPVSVSSRVLKFVDQEALESDSEANNHCSDGEVSVPATSSSTLYQMLFRSGIYTSISILS